MAVQPQEFCRKYKESLKSKNRYHKILVQMFTHFSHKDELSDNLGGDSMDSGILLKCGLFV